MDRTYNLNLKCLNKNQREIISNVNLKRKFNLITTRSNNLTCQIELSDGKKIYLHSKYRAEKEAKKYIDQYDLNNIETIILIGFGFGYYAEEILSRIKNDQKLNIVISSPDIFKVALKNKNFSKLLSDKRVTIILANNPQTLTNKLQELLINKKNSKLIYIKQLIRAIPKEFKFLRDVLEKIWINKKNNKEQKKQIKKNIKENLRFAVNDIGVNKFNELFDDVPIFIVAAGPSLDKNITELKNINDCGIILAVDTAITPLLKNNILPDFLVTIESNIKAYNKIFKRHSKLKVPLLYTIGSHYKTIKNYSGSRIVAFAEGDLSLDKLDKTIEKGRIETEGSVAATALDFAVKLGGNPIIFVGQDLAFANNKTHAENTFYQSNKLEEKHLRSIDGINDNKVFTNTAYYMYLRVIERYISEHSSIKFIDATEGGARIKGTEVNELKTVISAKCQKKVYKNNKIKKVINNYSSSEFNLKKIKKLMKEELN